MSKSQLHVATLVGTSTENAWAQTYHAGGVTAVVSVSQKDSEDKSTSLSLVGKDLLNTFESEYFTLETKNLSSIKQAVEVTYEKSKNTHNITFIVAAVIQNAVYLVLAGPGKILICRKNTIATLLKQDNEAVVSASGFLQSDDIMVLETPSFEEKITSSLLQDTLTANSIHDSAEILLPLIHKEKDGSVAALFFSYKEESTVIPEPTHHIEEEKKEKEPEEHVVQAPEVPSKSKKSFHLAHRQKIFLTVAIVLAFVFVGTVYFSLQRKQASKENTLFAKIYPPAQQKFKEGQSLESLNPSLARNDFLEAQQMLEGAKNSFPASSQEEKQILALLDQVNAQLGTTTPTKNATQATKVDSSSDSFLAFTAQHTSAKYFSKDDSNFYFADNTGITRFLQSGGSGKQIIQNGGDWKNIAGFQTYLGNMYILDNSDGIDKYAVTASGFGNKAAYFSGSAPDLSKAVSMAIDGSVWILSSDGTILKYTKGSQENFAVSGLSTPLSSPTQIFTTVDDDNIYILDNGNSRLVVLKKDGTFVAEHRNTLIKSATQLDVNESAKKAYFLSGGDIYEMDLK